MADFSDDFKMSFRSLGEVQEAVNLVTSRMKTAGVVFGQERKRITKEAFANAVFLWIASLPRAECERIVREGVVLLDQVELGGDLQMGGSDRGGPVVEAIEVVRPKRAGGRKSG